jgi:hypothetical protein
MMPHGETPRIISLTAAFLVVYLRHGNKTES